MQQEHLPIIIWPNGQLSLIEPTEQINRKVCRFGDGMRLVMSARYIKDETEIADKLCGPFKKENQK